MFQLLEKAQYRALDIEQLEEQRNAIVAQLEGESEFTTAELRTQAELCKAEIESRNAAVELRKANVMAVSMGAGKVIETTEKQDEVRTADVYDSVEYRTAFKAFTQHGEELPVQFRSNETTMTTDTGAVIPTTLMNKVITKLEEYGNIYAKVTKLNVKGGVNIPILSVKPKASWIGEGASESQKLTADDKVSFIYHGVEVKIAQSLLVSVVTLDAFEAKFVELAAEAMAKALDEAIIKGTGTDQPLGITKDTRITNVVEISLKEAADWSAWHKKVKAAIPKAYRNGEFVMAQGSFDGYIDGMTDTNGQPVGRVNYGINGEETYRFMGKNVETVEEDLLPSFEDAQVGDVIAVYGRLSDYFFNSNMQMRTAKWIDEDTNEVKNKCTMYCDGKVADPYGFVLIKLKASA